MAEKERIVRAAYNKIAREYQADRGIFDHTEELEELVSLLPRNARVLDVGCGAGVPVTGFLVKAGFDVVGIDFSESMLGLARKNAPQAQLIMGSMTKLGFRENSFDGLTAFYSIIHVPREKHLALFQSFHRILKPKGVMLICMGTDEWEAVEEYYGTRMFWSHYSPEISLELVKNSAFQIIFDRHILTGGERHYWILARDTK
ncbi:MAG: class I SAM-dependent methyltransferase [Candidatus Bathyarchaeota archaeon]|nr:class I SAM-dependent methyltransferase [Candidatus Bathyarchaeota archaeon]MDH5688372.1 class I SAM-dependent methyltransferase [Candidatus Bathyarchaeota archaeon]